MFALPILNSFDCSTYQLHEKLPSNFLEQLEFV